MKISNIIRINLILTTCGIAFFIPFLGSVHLFDWDEINFAECAREMIVSRNYAIVQINYQPFWEKPPLFIWMQVLSMKIFGINEFAARFPNAVCGIVTLLTVFNIGKKVFDEKFGWIWALAFAGSLLPHFYFKSGIIDPWFNLFIFSGIYYFIIFNNLSGSKNLVLSAIFIGLAILTKGPVALLIFLLTVIVFFTFSKQKSTLSANQIIAYAIVLFLTGASWFIYLIVIGKSNVVTDFILYQIRLFTTEDAGHGGPFFYHFIVLLIGCFPASVFAIRNISFRMFPFSNSSSVIYNNVTDTPFQKYYKRWMVVLFWTVLFLFSIVKTKIIHYSSLCYFPLTFLGAYTVHKMIHGELPWKRWMTYLTLIIALVIGIALMSLQFIDKYKTGIIGSGMIKDTFAIENLDANVHWSGWEFLIGLFFLVGILFNVLILKNKKLTMALLSLFIITLITTSMSIAVITPKIEQHVQGAAIEFYQHAKKEGFSSETIGFKSYAHLFYGEKAGGGVRYLVSKVTDIEKVKNEYPVYTEMYRKNGFVFWKKGM